jgi:precorrin-2 dehydrogenase/sirohydrochlorin ferrochelatase
MLRLAGRCCVVVGGGSVARRKVEALLRVDAHVVVIAPEIAPEIQRLAEGRELQLVARQFEPTDLDGALLAFAATGDRDVNRAVAEAAADRHILVNVADAPAACDFTVPSQVQRGDITVAISTGGRSPAFARYLREQLAAWLTDERCTLLEIAAEVRSELRSAGTSMPRDAWQRAIDDPAVAHAVEAGNRGEARARLRAALLDGR